MNNDKRGTIATVERVGRGILGDTGKLLKEVFEAGNIAVITAKNVETYGEIAVKSLITEGYAVRLFLVNDENTVSEGVPEIPEYIRFVLGVGSGKIADIARLTAAKNGIGYALAATAPSTESYLSDRVINAGDGRGVKCAFPEMLIIDRDVLDDAPDGAVAAGYGRIIAQLTNLFDAEFSGLIYLKRYDADGLKRLADIVREFELSKNDEGFNGRLFDTLLKIAKVTRELGFENTAADTYARVLSENLGRREGESSFLAAYVILNAYRAYLSADAVDVMLPADTVKSVKLLEKMRAINYNDYISTMYAVTSSGFLKQGFVLNEYKRELSDKLDGLDFSALTRFWRRLYDDAGFWLKSYATGGALLRYLSIAAELSENCLLKYLKRTGFLERFV